MLVLPVLGLGVLSAFFLHKKPTPTRVMLDRVEFFRIPAGTMPSGVAPYDYVNIKLYGTYRGDQPQWWGKRKQVQLQNIWVTTSTGRHLRAFSFVNVTGAEYMGDALFFPGAMTVPRLAQHEKILSLQSTFVMPTTTPGDETLKFSLKGRDITPQSFFKRS